MAGKVDKFVNPGKSTLFTVFALILIIGIPGFVAYADSSTDTYYSHADISDVAKVDINSSNWYSFGVTVAENGDSDTAVLDDTALDEATLLSSLTSVSDYTLVFVDDDISDCRKFTVSVDIENINTVSIDFRDSNNSLLLTKALEYDESSNSYFVVLSSVEAASIQSCTIAQFVFNILSNYYAAAMEEVNYDIDMYTSESVFTDDVVEMIVFIGGILLLVCGTFSLSFIDLNTPGKAFRAAGRGIKNNMRRN